MNDGKFKRGTVVMFTQNKKNKRGTVRSYANLGSYIVQPDDGTREVIIRAENLTEVVDKTNE